MRDPEEGPLGFPQIRRGHVNDLEKFCKERNLFTINAPIRRVTCKKLHKVFHKFLLRCFAP